MKTLKLLFGFALLATVFTSCYTEVIIEDPIIIDPVPAITLAELLESNELWYVDINRSNATGQIPFMQMAFTMSFRNGILLANNNLVGIGSEGYGFGIDIGYYDTYDMTLQTDHDLDGNHNFRVIQRNGNEIELYNSYYDVSYILVAYSRAGFDYDLVFYENIHYFLQEYTTWEKTYTSDYGNLNEFDNENFVAFLPGGGDGNFLSSQDPNGTDIDTIYWDYEGIYNVDDVQGDSYLKYLTLDYDFLGNEYFELSVINDNTVELFHEDSGTLYRFRGRGFIQLKSKERKLRKSKAQIEKSMKKISKF
jgi:hypothetical protein